MGKESGRKRESKRDGLSSSISDDTNGQRTASIERPLVQIRAPFIFVSLLLILANLVVYWQVRNHDFLNFDDNTYLTENPHVQAGLTWEGLVWAFSTTYANFWHPLTWLSYMLDYQIYGLKPGGYLSNARTSITQV